jgi:hypothetical protein
LHLPPALSARQRPVQGRRDRKLLDFAGVKIACHAVEEGRI